MTALPNLSQIAALNGKPRRKASYTPERPFDTKAFLDDCLSQIAGEQVVPVFLTNEAGEVTGFQVIAPGKAVVATITVTLEA